MTNSICVADQLDRRCFNMINGQRDHEHVQLESGRPRQAQQYPPELCRAICRGIRDQLHLNKHGLCMVERFDPGTNGVNSENIGKVLGEIHKLERAEAVPGEEETFEELDADYMEAYDDTNGEELDPGEVKKARRQEVDYIRSMRLYDKVPIAQCYNRTGKAPIAGRWLDRNKGDRW